MTTFPCCWFGIHLETFLSNSLQQQLSVHPLSSYGSWECWTLVRGTPGTGYQSITGLVGIVHGPFWVHLEPHCSKSKEFSMVLLLDQLWSWPFLQSSQRAAWNWAESIVIWGVVHGAALESALKELFHTVSHSLLFVNEELSMVLILDQLWSRSL